MTAGPWNRAWEQNREDLDGLAEDLRLAASSRSAHPGDCVRVLEEYLGRPCRGLRSLELGCGMGRLSGVLGLRGARVELLDSSSSAMERARVLFERLGLDPVYHVIPVAEALSATGGGYDLVCSSGLVEHFAGEERTRMWRAHFDLLRPGGVGLLAMPNASCPPYRLWKAVAEWAGLWSVGFEEPYTASEVRARLAALRVQGGRFGWGFWYAMNRFLLQKAYWGLRNLVRHRSFHSAPGEAFRPCALFTKLEGHPSVLDSPWGYTHTVWFLRPG
jgi:2-polyprenyl-3-methyl-5-hydroxy-6-metoxy-1,4-benzoquinol methylase